MPDRAPTHPSRATQRRRPEVETLAFHPRPTSDGGLVARLDNGVLVPPHPADADRVTPGEAWTCTLAEGPDGDTVARLVARIEPAPPPLDEEAGDGDAEVRGAPASPSSRARHRDPGGPDLHPGEREQLERRRQELRQRAELLLAQLEEVHDRLGDVEDALEG